NYSFNLIPERLHVMHGMIFQKQLHAFVTFAQAICLCLVAGRLSTIAIASITECPLWTCEKMTN
ncbi:MAG: hypothetical protein ACUVSL_08575, partial [Chloroflexus sp.]|uniref:hypothetical protein n=1 Tax=Chloroflexus sp. TaxID=1904827 RepID=UPI00404AD546